MALIGRISAIVRYPVKSMAGESLGRARLTSDGLEQDRLFAFESSGAPAGMLRVTGQERRDLLRYKARVLAHGRVEVLTPAGERLPVESAELLRLLQGPAATGSVLSLTRANTPQTDVRPLSLLSIQTVDRLAEELGQALDMRRFRANLLLDLTGGAFLEDALVGETVKLGAAVLAVRERDPRCRFVTYDPEAPDTEPLFGLMKLLDRQHEGRAGVYASVVVPGLVAVGDAIQVL